MRVQQLLKKVVCLGIMVPCMSIVLIYGPAYAGVEWRTDYTAALQQAKVHNKPLMVTFHASWCGWCHRLDREVYTDIKIVDFSRNFINIKIDGDRANNLVRKHHVKGYPTIVFLDPYERELGRIGGYVPVARYLEHMRLALSRFSGTSADEDEKQDSQPSPDSQDRKENSVKSAVHEYAREKADYRSATNLIKKADARFRARDLGSSLKYFKAVIDLYPGTPFVERAMERIDSIHEIGNKHLILAQNQYQSGEYKAARDNFRIGLQLFPESLHAANAYRRLQEIARSKQIERNIAQKELEDDAYALLQLADNYRLAGRNDLAEEHYRRVIEKYPQTRFIEDARRGLNTLD